MGRRAAFAVGAGAAQEVVVGEAGAAVAQGPLRGLWEKRGELGLGQHPLARKQIEDPQVKLRKGWVALTGAAARGGSAHSHIPLSPEGGRCAP